MPPQMRLATSPNYLPTRREVLLVLVLVTILLLVSENDYLLSWDARSSGSKATIAANSKDAQGVMQSEEFPEPLFTWKDGEVPETEIVRHAYGEWGVVQ